MPIFALIARDRADAGTLRADTRPQHLAYLDALGDALVRAGPLTDDGGAVIGSLVFYEAPDLAAARAHADADPYAGAGLFASAELFGWRQVLP